ncbi:hypothetical protein K523DRAFT_357584 [Schizophyllum commune Tattone D]|nr:hypothetical protein K523DRAFT_357584 [Schizophyllum commune Tattone D]
MKKQLEKCWKTYNQQLMVITLFLNPRERLKCFGDNVNASSFTIASEFMCFYTCVMSRPISGPSSGTPGALSSSPPSPEVSSSEDDNSDSDSDVDLTSERRHTHVQADPNTARNKRVRNVFMQYLADTGPFADWAAHHAEFASDHPVLVWQQFLGDCKTHKLAEFAIMCLGLCLNQAGNEHDFSDLKIKQTRLWNQLANPRLEKISKVGASIHAKHSRLNLADTRKKRQIHEADTAAELLVVPRYADVLEGVHNADAVPPPAVPAGDAAQPEEASSQNHPILITLCAAWRKSMASWAEAQRESEELARAVSEDWEPTTITTGPACWLPCSLELLFGGKAHKPAAASSDGAAFTAEERLMELLDAEASDNKFGMGEEEGSGTDYDPAYNK